MMGPTGGRFPRAATTGRRRDRRRPRARGPRWESDAAGRCWEFCRGERPTADEGRRTLTAHGLIDTTEMYLRTIFELEEEGIVPLRARIAERLQQSGPTVSQTVARMERDGLLRVENDRHLVMTEEGRRLATHVMRKHR